GREGAAKFLELGGIEDFYNSPKFTGAGSSKEKVALYNAAMRDAALTRTTAEWMRLGEENRIPIMRANTMDGVLHDPHLKAGEFLQEKQPPTEGGWRTMNPPIYFSKTPASIRRPPPKPGADTEEVFREMGVPVKPPVSEKA